MLHRIFVAAAWACLIVIAAVTLLPQGFRPHMFSQRVEHLLAFGATGLCFGLAYPRRLAMVAAIVLGSAVVLEALQLVAPGRHANLVDLIAKIIGGTAGLAAAMVVTWLRRRWVAPERH